MLDQHLHESTAGHLDADPDPGQIATTQPEQPLNKLCDSGTRMWNRALTHDLATVVDNANLMRLCRPVNADKQRIVIALHICSSCSGRCDARSPLYGRSQAQTPHGPLIAGQTSRAQVPPRHSQCRGANGAPAGWPVIVASFDEAHNWNGTGGDSPPFVKSDF